MLDFQLNLESIVMRETNSTNKRIRPKIYIFEDAEGGGGTIKLISRTSTEAHFRPTPNPHTKLQSLSSIWRGVMRGTNFKNKKTRSKNIHFCGYERVQGGMGLKCRNHHKAHLWLSHTKFQLPSSIRMGNMGGTAPFQDQNGENHHIPPP